jgi:hypothetical protein
VQIFGIVLGIAVASWVHSDASVLKKKGANLSPSTWAAAVFLAWILTLPLYHILRITAWRRQISLAKGETPSALTSEQIAAVSALSVVLLVVCLGILAYIGVLWERWT